MAFERLNDGTDAPPRLRIQQTWWGMTKLPMNVETEWSLAEKLDKVAGAGFEGLEAWLGPEIEAEIAQGCKARGLHLSLGHRPYKPEDTKKLVEQALRVDAPYVLAQPADAYTSLKDVVNLVTEGRKMANDAGLCYFVETHRGNFTENIPQTLALIEAVPDIRITADLSHFIVVGEFYGWDDEKADQRMGSILERVTHIHGRVSNGEQVQVDCGDGSTPWARFFVKLWSIAIKHWLKDAGPGDILPFSAELGPPRYAITAPDGKEISDRWEQAILMGKLAKEAWDAAQK